ncbi:hypothetical protein COB72_04725 [bacterium]|nr:MAG: hypothetical protein COB72_04725 [bacterium]
MNSTFARKVACMTPKAPAPQSGLFRISSLLPQPSAEAATQSMTEGTFSLAPPCAPRGGGGEADGGVSSPTFPADALRTPDVFIGLKQDRNLFIDNRTTCLSCS